MGRLARMRGHLEQKQCTPLHEFQNKYCHCARRLRGCHFHEIRERFHMASEENWFHKVRSSIWLQGVPCLYIRRVLDLPHVHWSLEVSPLAESVRDSVCVSCWLPVVTSDAT